MISNRLTSDIWGGLDKYKFKLVIRKFFQTSCSSTEVQVNHDSTGSCFGIQQAPTLEGPGYYKTKFFLTHPSQKTHLGPQIVQARSVCLRDSDELPPSHALAPGAPLMVSQILKNKNKKSGHPLSLRPIARSPPLFFPFLSLEVTISISTYDDPPRKSPP